MSHPRTLPTAAGRSAGDAAAETRGCVCPTPSERRARPGAVRARSSAPAGAATGRCHWRRCRQCGAGLYSAGRLRDRGTARSGIKGRHPRAAASPRRPSAPPTAQHPRPGPGLRRARCGGGGADAAARRGPASGGGRALVLRPAELPGRCPVPPGPQVRRAVARRSRGSPGRAPLWLPAARGLFASRPGRHPGAAVRPCPPRDSLARVCRVPRGVPLGQRGCGAVPYSDVIAAKCKSGFALSYASGFCEVQAFRELNIRRSF